MCAEFDRPRESLSFPTLRHTPPNLIKKWFNSKLSNQGQSPIKCFNTTSKNHFVSYIAYFTPCISHRFLYALLNTPSLIFPIEVNLRRDVDFPDVALLLLDVPSVYLTQSVDYLVLESQLPHKIVNLIF